MLLRCVLIVGLLHLGEGVSIAMVLVQVLAEALAVLESGGAVKTVRHSCLSLSLF